MGIVMKMRLRGISLLFFAAAIAVLVTIISINGASAQATLNTWVYSNEPFTFNSNTYYAYLSNDYSSVLIRSNDTNIALPFGQCQEYNFILFCYKNYSVSDLKHIKYDTNGNQIHGFNLLLNVTGPILEVTNTIDKTSVDVNDIISGRISIKNSGNRASSEAHESIIINSSASFLTCGGCDEVSSHLGTTKIGDILVDGFKVINYKLQVGSPENFNIYSNLTYYYEGKQYSKYQKLATVIVHSPYSLAWTSSPASVLIGSEVTGKLNVSNTGNLPISVNLSYVIPKGYDMSGDLFSLLGQDGITLDPGQSKVYNYAARSTDAGSWSTKLNFSITRSDGEYSVQKTLTQNYNSANLKITAKSGKKEAISEDSDNYYVIVQNNAHQPFKNIIVVAHGFFNGNKSIGSISQGQVINVFSDYFKYPAVNEKTVEKENVTVFYQTQYGTQYNETITSSATIYPLNESYVITRSVAPSLPSNGEKFTVKVYGQKLVNSNIQVNNVQDLLYGVNITNGLNQGKAVLTDSKQLLYSYNAIRNSSQYFLINTTATLTFGTRKAELSNVLENGTRPIPVQASGSGSGNNASAGNKGSDSGSGSSNGTIKEPGAAPKSSSGSGGFFSAIANFFRRIFG